MRTNPTPRRRWVMPLLAVSLAANLLVVGMAAGAFWRVKDGHKSRSGPSGAVYLRALGRADRRAIFAEMREGRKGARAADADQRQVMLNALRADPFDPARVEEVLALQRAQGQTTRAAVEAKWLTVISGMSAADRAAYADRLQTEFERRSKKRPRPQAD